MYDDTPIAILYGIYSNWPALEAILLDAQYRGVKRFICLGDIVSTGPFPIECLEWVLSNCELALLGYWDEGLENPDNLWCCSAILRKKSLI